MCNGQSNDFEGRDLRTIFETIPLPTFIVDSDVRIQDYNLAATQLLGHKPELTLHLRGGDALHCIHAEAAGCGYNEPCKGCVIRNSVKEALTGGKTHRRVHKAELRTPEKTAEIDLLISATPLPGEGALRVLLILEDISELLTLRGLLPICAQCKKVRDDRQYWHSIDTYLRTHMNMRLTHGLCPGCFAEQMKIIESYGPPKVKCATA